VQTLQMMRRSASTSVALIVVIATILWAGLRPFEFNAPNKVNWVDGGNGLAFDAGGMAFTNDFLVWDTESSPANFSLVLEIDSTGWSKVSDVKRVLFALVDDLRMPALVAYHQNGEFTVADRVTNPDGERWYNDFRMAISNVESDAIRITVIDDGNGPQLFVNGRVEDLTSGYPIPIGRAGEILRGRLFFGTDPLARNPWSGEIISAALHDGPSVLATYTFNEGSGSRVKNAVADRFHLVLPQHYRSSRRPLSYVDADTLDIAINILGFIPLGFLLFIAFGRDKTALLFAVSTGAILSLGIEWAQSYSIHRSSSSLDWILNTLGTVFGSLIAHRLPLDGIGRK
jgi:VanZ family protein